MKKLKILAIITMIILILFIAGVAVFAFLGVFSFTAKEPDISEGIILTPEEAEKIYLVPEDSAIKARIKTNSGNMLISLSDTSAAEKFIELANAKIFDGAEFSVLAENMFIQTKTEGENFSVEKTDFACLYGTVGFAMDSGMASPGFFIITNSGLSGISKSYMQSENFQPKKAALYEENGGMPEYEGKVVIFGRIVMGTQIPKIIEERENSGYTGGYLAAEPVIIESVEIIYPESVSD